MRVLLMRTSWGLTTMTRDRSTRRFGEERLVKVMGGRARPPPLLLLRAPTTRRTMEQVAAGGGDGAG
jgi:hypothetical protein